jgi:hypothetical protein
MDRAQKFALIGLPALALAGFLFGCVTFTRSVSFHLISWDGKMTLEVYVAKPGVYFNPHGGRNYDRYTLDFPAGQDHIPASQVREYLGDGKPDKAFAASGSIDLKFDSAGCELRIDLKGVDGLPFAANGTHGARYCGLEKP